MTQLKKIRGKEQKISNMSAKADLSNSAYFSRADLIWIVVGIILLFLLGYAVIQFNIVSQDAFISGAQKYNVTVAPKVAQVLTASPVSLSNKINSFVEEDFYA